MDQILKDSHGGRLGSIKQEGNRQILKDSRGRRVGTGNLLTSLLTP